MAAVGMDWVEPSHGASHDLREAASKFQFLVVTGAPGSGKSRLIEELRSHDVANSLELIPATMAPRTDVWRRLALHSIDLGYWEALWRSAIWTSFITFLVEHVDLLSPSSKSRLDAVKAELPAEVFKLNYAKHPYAIINIFGATYRMGNDNGLRLKSYAPVWDRVEEVVTYCFTHNKLPSVLIELDHLDDYFDNNPTVMAEIQAGLALYLLRQQQHVAVPGELRVRSAVRHTTRNFIIRNGGPDVHQQAGLVEIKWTKGAINLVLDETIRAEMTASSTLSTLYVGDTIDVPQRGISEDPTEYLLRHTTLTPRDIQQVAKGLIARHRLKDSALTAREVRYAVAEYSEMLATTTLHQLLSDLRALGGRVPTTRRVALLGGTDQGPLESSFRQMIERAGSESLTRLRLLELIEEWDEISRPFVSECLWTYRLIGQHDRHEQELRISRSIGDRLMNEYESLLLHPILLDLCSIRPMSEGFTIEYV